MKNDVMFMSNDAAVNGNGNLVMKIIVLSYKVSIVRF